MLQTQIRYLARDHLYQKEKPYAADFEVDEQDGARKSNFITQVCEVQVAAISQYDKFDMDVNGFCVLEENTTLSAEDALNRPEEVEHEYQAQLEQILHKRFPEYARLEALDFVVRQRHALFPSEATAFLKFEQPAAMAHADYTKGGAVDQLRGSFPGQESYFLGRDYDMINVWKPLIGPNSDWPLTLCDYSSITSSDVIHADVLHIDRTTENQLLFPNRNHRWYYIADQRPTQLLVFRNVSSTADRAVGFHAAVPNPNSKGAPRVSVEVRFVAFRK